MRIVILTYESHQANLMTQRLLRDYPGQVVGILSSDVIVAGKNTWQSMAFLLRRTGLGFVALKGTEIILSRLAGLFFRLSSQKPAVPSLAQMAADYGVPLVKAKKVNAADKVALVESWRPDLIISIYCNQLIRAKLINLAPQGAINVHPALLPKNRGLFPYFWALTNGDAETGVTVHWMDTKFDTGEILLQEKLPIAPDDTVISLARKSAELGADLLSCAVKLIQQGEPPRLAQDTTQVSYFSWPTAADVHRFRQQGRRYGSITEMWKDLV